jgi:hypothetical protein
METTVEERRFSAAQGDEDGSGLQPLAGVDV